MIMIVVFKATFNNISVITERCIEYTLPWELELLVVVDVITVSTSITFELVFFHNINRTFVNLSKFESSNSNTVINYMAHTMNPLCLQIDASGSHFCH